MEKEGIVEIVGQIRGLFRVIFFNGRSREKMDKIYIFNFGNARESVKFIVREARHSWRKWSLKDGKHKSETGIGEQTVIPISSVNLK